MTEPEPARDVRVLENRRAIGLDKPYPNPGYSLA
jgi:hypothetical protein